MFTYHTSITIKRAVAETSGNGLSVRDVITFATYDPERRASRPRILVTEVRAFPRDDMVNILLRLDEKNAERIGQLLNSNHPLEPCCRTDQPCTC